MKQPIILIGLGTLLSGIVLGFVIPNVNTAEDEVLERTYVVSEEAPPVAIVSEEIEKNSKKKVADTEPVSQIRSNVVKESKKDENKGTLKINKKVNEKKRSEKDGSHLDSEEEDALNNSKHKKKEKHTKKRVSKRELMKLDPLIYSRSIQFSPRVPEEKSELAIKDTLDI
ncbi:MAG: hypothetical protein ACJA0Q_002195 [Saprospiraceae bacterium]|jgi:hypothetical protein